MLGNLLVTFLLFWMYTTKILHLKLKNFRIGFGVQPWGILLAVLLPACVVGAYLMAGTAEINAVPVSEMVLIISASALTALKAGVLEEMLFRGFWMTLLENRWNRAVAVLAPSFLFSLAHLPSMEQFTLAGVLLLVLSGTLVGIMFSLTTYRGNTIGNSVLLHAVWNFVMVTGIVHITTPQGAYGDPLVSITLSTENILLTGGGFGVEASLVSIVGYALVCVAVLIPGNGKPGPSR
ncbi:MAG: CPBP family intramembrane glutamic endopeptidase [Oscillospiraceae bacterium]|nr:CPBP family intramembrane glutamic endopeptidase [Oscillospiraceae bacterium]